MPTDEVLQRLTDLAIKNGKIAHDEGAKSGVMTQALFDLAKVRLSDRIPTDIILVQEAYKSPVLLDVDYRLMTNEQHRQMRQRLASNAGGESVFQRDPYLILCVCRNADQDLSEVDHHHSVCFGVF